MAAENDKVFEFASLDKYSFGERLFIRSADLAFFLLIKVIGRTLKFETDGMHHLTSLEDADKMPVLAFWHDRIFTSTYYFRGRSIVVITSQSKDGEYIARFIQRFGYGAVRGSSSRGGVGALVEMIRMMRKGSPMGFTVDGPKGPRYEAKSGPVILAKKTGNPIVPFLIEAERFWTVNSWDRLQIPKPFSRCRVFVGSPIYVDTSANADMIAEKTDELQRSLDDLVAVGAKWRQGV